ncbi:MAG: exodeoxyribonuclease III [Syntrophales bacterium]|jgi:exodeoxyribonuclease-3|nr:exodeoxyribonuclease III [Syntrophales bacterium]MCK9528503.1 exodeoxyribonuclease III [Syntrophales bacterium]MDX9923040.1 exodeoxyribonuclease III [Syntrophales bacterium]
MKSFRVATFNVNSIRARLHIVLPWLEKHRPRFLCLQETKVADEAFPSEEFGKAGYHVIFRGAKRYNGVAIACLDKPVSVSFGFDDDGPPDEDRIIQATYDDGVTVLNLYVPQGRDREHPQFDYKLVWFERLVRYLERCASPEEPLVLCGDLNVARDGIDVHDPKRLLGHVDFTPEVWDRFDRLLAWGLDDIFRKHNRGVEKQFTYFDYRVPGALDRQLGWRVDHILATPPLAARSQGSCIDLEPRRMEKPSDHTILVAKFSK